LNTAVNITAEYDIIEMSKNIVKRPPHIED